VVAEVARCRRGRGRSALGAAGARGLTRRGTEKRSPSALTTVTLSAAGTAATAAILIEQ